MENTFYKENKNKYELLAVKTVISYFKSERIRVNISDFTFIDGLMKSSEIKDARVESYYDSLKNIGNTTIKISHKAPRFKKYVGEKANNFLKYVNCRVTKDEIIFTFSWAELDKIGVDKIELTVDEKQKNKIEKVKVLIEKLFALADKNPSENEALSANNKAQQLLSKYHLTVEEVYGAEMKIGDGIEQVICDCGVGNSKCNWRYRLANAIAGGYCCKTYSVGNQTDGRVVFYGYKDDVLLARRMYTYLFESCHKLGLKYQRENPSIYNSYTGFCVGFVEGAKTSMEKQCTALALVVQPEVEESWEDFSKSFGTRNERQKSIDMRAYSDGVVEGKRSLGGKYIEG